MYKNSDNTILFLKNRGGWFRDNTCPGPLKVLADIFEGLRRLKINEYIIWRILR